MQISISKENPLVNKSSVELAFAEIICKNSLKPNSRVLFGLLEMVPFVTIASHTRMLC